MSCAPLVSWYDTPLTSGKFYYGGNPHNLSDFKSLIVVTKSQKYLYTKEIEMNFGSSGYRFFKNSSRREKNIRITTTIERSNATLKGCYPPNQKRGEQVLRWKMCMILFGGRPKCLGFILHYILCKRITNGHTKKPS